MKPNHVVVTYWVMLSLLGVSGFFFMNNNLYEIVLSALYALLIIITLSITLTIGMDRRNNYQGFVIKLAMASMALHVITYTLSLIAADKLPDESIISTIVVIAINAIILTYLYIFSKGEQ